MTPYIGVSAIMTPQDARDVMNMVPSGARRRVMLGTVASLKTLNGLPNRWPRRFLKMDRLRSIYPNDRRSLCLIHYSSHDPSTLDEQLLELMRLTGPHLNGFQLNIPWPSPDALYAVRDVNPDATIILQVGERALSIVNHRADLFADEFSRFYDGLVDGVLIDMSRGRGVALIPEETLSLVRMMQETRNHMEHPLGIGISGKLGPDTMHLLTHELLDAEPDLSIDAEGDLRSENDDLDLTRVEPYLAQAFSRLEGIN